jgi:hypothetical protein
MTLNLWKDVIIPNRLGFERRGKELAGDDSRLFLDIGLKGN